VKKVFGHRGATKGMTLVTGRGGGRGRELFFSATGKEGNSKTPPPPGGEKKKKIWERGGKKTLAQPRPLENEEKEHGVIVCKAGSALLRGNKQWSGEKG